MKPRTFDPRHLDVETFAKSGESLTGTWPALSLQRLVDAAHAEAKPTDADTVPWSATGESRPMRRAAPQTWLRLHASASLNLVCQRCLGPVHAEVAVDRSFLFAADEATAASLDSETEDDVLVLTRSLDLRELAEDELLLALPLVPRHDDCSVPLVPDSTQEQVFDSGRPNPFAALARLKTGDQSD